MNKKLIISLLIFIIIVNVIGISYLVTNLDVFSDRSIHTYNKMKNVTEAILKEDVEVIKVEESKEISKSILYDSEYIDDKLIVTLNNISIEEGKVFMLEPSEDFPLGFSGKVSKIIDDDQNTKYVIEQPTLQEMFNELDIDIKSTFDADNIIDMNFVDGVEFIDNNTSALVASLDDVKIKNDKFKFDEDIDGWKSGKISLSFNDTELKYKDIKAKLKGSFSLNDIVLHSKVKFKDGNSENKIKNFESYEAYISAIPSVNTSFSIEGNLEASIKKDEEEDSLKFLRIEGVDLEDRLVLGHIIFGVSAIPIQAGVGEPNIYMPIAATIEFTTTLTGKISGEVTIGTEYSCYVKKGFKVNKMNGHTLNKHKFNTGNLITGRTTSNPNIETVKYDGGEAVIEVINEFGDENKNTENKPEVKRSIQGKGEMNATAGIGLDIGLYIGNLNIARMFNDLKAEADLTVEAVKDNEGSKISLDGNMEAYYKGKVVCGIVVKDKSDDIVVDLKYEKDIVEFTFWKKEFSKEIEVSNNNEEENNNITKEKGFKIQDFIPVGWGTLSSVEGDLNKDGLLDIAVVVENNNQRKFLILLKSEDNSYELSIESDNAILSSDAGGAWGDPFESISINRGSILISHYGGSAERWSSKYRFRLQDGGWYLIGATLENYNSNTLEGTYKDYNLLTGDMEKVMTDVSGNKSTKKKNIGKKTLINLKDFKIYGDYSDILVGDMDDQATDNNPFLTTLNKPKLNLKGLPTIIEYELAFTNLKEGESVYYTLDNTKPTENSKRYTENPLYEEPIYIGKGKSIIRAIKVNENGAKSDEVKLEYNVTSNPHIYYRGNQHYDGSDEVSAITLEEHDDILLDNYTIKTTSITYGWNQIVEYYLQAEDENGDIVWEHDWIFNSDNMERVKYWDMESARFITEFASPYTITEDKIFIIVSNTLHVFDLKTGELKWKAELKDPYELYSMWLAPAVDVDGTVYCVHEQEFDIISVSPNGSINWKKQAHYYPVYVKLDDKYVYVMLSADAGDPPSWSKYDKNGNYVM